MNRGEKAAVYVVLVLAALAACSGILYLTGWATTIKNVVVLGGRGSSMTNLARRTPFVPPADGLVRRERLEAYLRICCAIKPVGDKIDAWEETHQHGAKSGKPAFKGQAAGLVGDFLGELETALQREEMGPAEFAWVADCMRAAQDEVGRSVQDPDLVAQAKVQAETLLHGFYRELGWDVSVQWQEPQGAAAPDSKG